MLCYYVSAVQCCCARALEGLVRAESLVFGPRRATEREALDSVKWGASDDRGQRAALTLASPPSPHLATLAAPRSHIIYDSIRTQASSRFSILYQGTTANNKSFFISCHSIFVQICNSLKFQLKSGVRQLMTLLKMKIFVKNSVTLFIASHDCVRWRQALIKQYVNFH